MSNIKLQLSDASGELVTVNLHEGITSAELAEMMHKKPLFRDVLLEAINVYVERYVSPQDMARALQSSTKN